MKPQSPAVDDLVRRAQNAMAQRRPAEAAELWARIAALAPDHPQAKLQIAIAQLNIAFARRQAGDMDGELGAYNNALAADPLCYPALLGKAALLERLGKARQAAKIYRDALKLEPPRDQLPPALAAQFDEARQAVQADSRRMSDYLRERLGAERAQAGEQDLRRFDACVGVVAGTREVYTVKPTLLHFPALPAIEFYDNESFPLLAALEAQSDFILEELTVLLREDAGGFNPYVNKPAGTPLNQWAELNASPQWSAFFLWEDGKPIEQNCRRCPKTAALLEASGMADVPGYAPTAFFSLLKPHTHIPPHTGVTNTRLIVHLPLIVPEKCRFRVGGETRDWEQGKAWVFDDTIEHEAWNDSDRTRVILIFDVWNPFLTEPERKLIGPLLQGVDAYYRSE
ncbi:MAG: aspartyl/asparaginyl beta-hydroxylase domain-containing protein [Rhizomicrobium sp.]